MKRRRFVVIVGVMLLVSVAILIVNRRAGLSQQGILLTSSEKNQPVITQSYNVADVVRPIAGLQSPANADFEPILEALRPVVPHQEDGNAILPFDFNSSIVIRGTQATHDRVSQVLADLRRQQTRPSKS